MPTALTPTPTLAQFSIDAPPPTPLPGPNPLIHYTLESPMLLTVLLIAAAAIAYFVLNSRGKAKLALRVPIAIILTAALINLAAHFLATDREIVLGLTKDLVRAVVAGDVSKVDPLLTQDAKLYSPASNDGIPKDQLLNRIQTMLGPNGAVRISDYAILETQVDASDASLAQVQVKVRVTPDGFGPTLSWWRLDAVPVNNQWRVSGVKYLSSNVPIPDLTGSGRGS